MPFVVDLRLNDKRPEGDALPACVPSSLIRVSGLLDATSEMLKSLVSKSIE